MTNGKRVAKYYRCEGCGVEFIQFGIGPHQRNTGHQGRTDLGMREAPPVAKKYVAKRRVPAVIPHPTYTTHTPQPQPRVIVDQRDLPITVVRNMEVVRRGDRIGIVEWQDHEVGDG